MDKSLANLSLFLVRALLFFVSLGLSPVLFPLRDFKGEAIGRRVNDAIAGELTLHFLLQPLWIFFCLIVFMEVLVFWHRLRWNGYINIGSYAAWGLYFGVISLENLGGKLHYIFDQEVVDYYPSSLFPFGVLIIFPAILSYLIFSLSKRYG